jgi:hypothetical protein
MDPFSLFFSLFNFFSSLYGSSGSTGFKACASFAGGSVDLTRGTSKDLQSNAAYGMSTGWTEKGYKPADGTALWGYFMFWSNVTAA